MLFANLGKEEAAASLKMIHRLREAGISAEIYADGGKMKKQLGYANSLSIPYVAIIGETELSEGKVTLKNMVTGEQNLLTIDEVITIING